MQTDKSSDQSGRGDESLDDFISALTASQSKLRAYLTVALGNQDDAAEVLQRTNLVLWRNASKFRQGEEFMPWAVTLARFEVRSFYRDRGRDRLVFADDVADLMLDTVSREYPNVSEREAALKRCLGELPGKSRDLIRLRYEDRASFQKMAEQLKRTEGAIRTALARVRRTLEVCIESRLQS